MQPQYEEQYHKVESSHWWFVARRRAVRHLLRSAEVNQDSQILEIGCSAGPLMLELREEGCRHLTGIDCSRDAIERCIRLGLDARQMDAQQLTFSDEAFDAIIASDILEHLQDDRGALREWRRTLRPGGKLILFVPAFAFLWSNHDVVNKHCRRYDRRALVRLIEEAGLVVERDSYWNAFLFFPVALVRGAKRLLRGDISDRDEGGTGDLFMPPHWVNLALRGLLHLENQLLRMGVNWPAGVSVMAVARKPAK